MAAIAAVNPNKNTSNITIAILDCASGCATLCEVVTGAGRGDAALDIFVGGG